MQILRHLPNKAKMGLRHLHSVVGCPPFPHTHTSQGIKVPQTLSLGQSFCLLRTLIPKTQWAEEGRRGEGRREKRRKALWWWKAVMPKPTWSSPGGNPQVGHWTAWVISAPETTGTHWRLWLMPCSFPFLLWLHWSCTFADAVTV